MLQYSPARPSNKTYASTVLLSGFSTITDIRVCPLLEAELATLSMNEEETDKTGNADMVLTIATKRRPSSPSTGDTSDFAKR
jgi:hypothetical protein